MPYSINLSLFLYSIIIFTMGFMTTAAPGPSFHPAARDTIPSTGHPTLQQQADHENTTNAGWTECFNTHDHSFDTGGVNKQDCMHLFYDMLKDRGASFPVRWDLVHVRSPDYVLRESYKTCSVTMRKATPGARGLFAPLAIIHQAAIIVDECVKAQTGSYGGQGPVSRHIHFIVEVGHAAKTLEGDSSNGSIVAAGGGDSAGVAATA